MTSIQALVVDDSRSARKVLERMLQKANVSVSTVEDAESALAYLQQETPSIVFMDHMMPGMNGFEATQALRQMPHLRHVPTIMYTSKDDTDYLAQARAHGANDVLCKPAKQDKLQTIIDLYLNNATQVDVESQDAHTTTDESESPQQPVTDSATITPTSTLNGSHTHASAEDLTLLIQQQLRQPLRVVNDNLLQAIEDSKSHSMKAVTEHLASVQSEWESKLQEAVKQAKVSPSALFKTLQPVLQKLSLQVANKVVSHHIATHLEPIRESAEQGRSELERISEQLKQTQQQHLDALAQQKRLTLTALACAAFALAGVGALIANTLS